MVLVALIPVLVQEMSLSYYDIGLLGFGLLISVAVQFMVGRIADRVVSKYLLEVGAGLMGASFVLILLVNDFPTLFAVVIVMRIGAAFYHPVGTSWITREFSGPYLDTAIGVQSGVGNFGVILALGTSGFLAEAYGWKTPCVLWATLNFAAVIAGTLLLKETKANTLIGAKLSKRSSRETFDKMWLLVVPIIGGGALYQITSYFGPINLTESGRWTAGSADLAFAVWICIGTVTSYYFGSMSTRYGKEILLQFGYLLGIIAPLALAFSSQWQIVIPVVLVYGAFLFMTYPALFSIISEATDPAERGTAFGILFGFQLGGGATMVYLSGILADSLDDPSIPFVIVAALSLASLVTVQIWLTRRRNVKTV
jgi:MFS family permease